MPMIKQASRAIEHMTARERRIQRAKYARRNKMHYIDKLLNELEMLNLADQRQMPPVLSTAVNKVIEESPEVTVLAQAKPASVIALPNRNQLARYKAESTPNAIP